MYAGVLVGVVFEVARRVARRPGQATYWLSGAGLLLMGVVGFSGLHKVMTVPVAVKVFTALWFGWSVAALAVASIVAELAPDRTAAVEHTRWRWVFLAGLALAGMLVAWGWPTAIQVLGVLATVGVPATFVVVNLAAALVVLRFVRRRRWRVGIAVVLVPLLVVLEFAMFIWWRRT